MLQTWGRSAESWLFAVARSECCGKGVILNGMNGMEVHLQSGCKHVGTMSNSKEKWLLARVARLQPPYIVAAPKPSWD